MGKVGQQRRCRESCLAKLAHLLGALLLILFVAVPKDLVRWLRLRRKSVRDQTIVITGGASGIGQRMAELLADQEKVGARVAIIDTNLEAAEKVAQGIVKQGGYAAAWKCDVVDGDEMRKTADKIKRHFGQINIVICNAAILYFADTLELQDHEIQRALNVNVLGTINTIRAFLPEFEAQERGQFAIISSITGFFGETFGMAYCPTKFAVRGVAECLRMELRDRGLDNNIVCTTICPYFVRTPMILSKGIRPISRWIPFMSVEACSNMIVDAVLKEKILAFMPSWLCVFAMLKNLFSLNMMFTARDFINCRYEYEFPESVVEEAAAVEISSSSSTRDLLSSSAAGTNGPTLMMAPPPPPPTFVCAAQIEGEGKLGMAPKIHLRQQMRDHFVLAHPLWWTLIPAAMLLTLMTYCYPDLFNVPGFGPFGQFIYRLGTEHAQPMLWLNIFAWAAHLLEAIVGLYLAESLRLSHKSCFLWFVQTLCLGFPSLRLLIKQRRKEH